MKAGMACWKLHGSRSFVVAEAWGTSSILCAARNTKQLGYSNLRILPQWPTPSSEDRPPKVPQLPKVGRAGIWGLSVQSHELRGTFSSQTQHLCFFPLKWALLVSPLASQKEENTGSSNGLLFPGTGKWNLRPKSPQTERQCQTFLVSFSWVKIQQGWEDSSPLFLAQQILEGGRVVFTPRERELHL